MYLHRKPISVLIIEVAIAAVLVIAMFGAIYLYFSSQMEDIETSNEMRRAKDTFISRDFTPAKVEKAPIDETLYFIDYIDKESSLSWEIYFYDGEVLAYCYDYTGQAFLLAESEGVSNKACNIISKAVFPIGLRYRMIYTDDILQNKNAKITKKSLASISKYLEDEFHIKRLLRV